MKTANILAIKYIDNILKERGTNLKEIEDRGIHLNRIPWQ